MLGLPSDTMSPGCPLLPVFLYYIEVFSSYLMIVSEVTCLTHSHRVEESVWVCTVPRILVPSILPVATGTHVLKDVRSSHDYLSVVLSVHMWTLGNLHDLLIARLLKVLQVLKSQT